MASNSDIRIARNTVIIYIRMAVTILVGLITSRLVLQALGASDVGIYSAVGSTVALVGAITGALSSTTIRFMNIEIGKVDGNPNRMFNICHAIHLGGAAVILLLLESIGLWYIHTHLNVLPGKESDAMFVFQVSTIVACLAIANTPFQSLFTIHEQFGTVALVDIFNTLLKLGLVALLYLMQGHPDGLRIYAVMMSASTWISFIAYHWMSARRWPDIVRWKPVREKSAYREVMTFNNYNLLSSSAVIARSQGSNMLINASSGPPPTRPISTPSPCRTTSTSSSTTSTRPPPRRSRRTWAPARWKRPRGWPGAPVGSASCCSSCCSSPCSANWNS